MDPIILPSRGDKTVKVFADLMCIRAWELLDYNEETGEFRWKARRQGVKLGSVAGYIGSSGYHQIRIDGTPYPAHRLAWLMGTGYWPVNQIDHRNRIKHDNRLKNLREATNAQNKQNLSMLKTNTSGYKGVSWYSPTGKWKAQIQVDGKNRSLGYFATPKEASEAYKRAKRELHTFNPETES